MAQPVPTPNGPLNYGPGPQFNSYYQTLPTDSRGRSPRRQAADDLRKLAQCFVYPRGFGEARKILHDNRTVFLYAPPGSGKTTAAKLLLRELATPAGMIHELLLQDNDPENHRSPLDVAHIGDRDHVWLDLTNSDGWPWSKIRSEFPSLREKIHEHEAYLVVVLPDPAARFDPEIIRYCAAIERPPIHQVIKRHLRVAGFPPTEPIHKLDERPLRDVAEYVRLIIEAKDQAREKRFSAWCETAFKALSGRETEVGESIAALTNGSQRALLIAVAMLHGAHSDVIEQATISLLNNAKQPSDQCPILERAALDHRLSEIKAQRDQYGNVRFLELGYDAAVRAYFWTHMSSLREPTKQWVDNFLSHTSLEQSDRDNLIWNFTGQCLNERYRPILVKLVAQYTEGSDTNHRTKAAALILRRGLRAEQCGRAFRKQIYDWSRDDGLPDARAAVIIDACRNEISATHADEAIVRLHHVARRKPDSEARQELLQLVSTDRRFQRQILSRITERDPSLRKWKTDLRIFLDIANPQSLTDPGERNRPLIAEEGARRQLRAGWRLVFASPDHVTWEPRAQDWLERAAEDEEHRHALLDILVHGGAQSASVLSRLYAMTRLAEFRDAIIDLVLEKITVAQGVELA